MKLHELAPAEGAHRARRRIARGTGSMQAGSRSLSSGLDFGVHVALGQAGGRFADPNASHEERQMTLCLTALGYTAQSYMARSLTRLALRLQDCAC